MKFVDYPDGKNPYIRLFCPDDNAIQQAVFSAHGIWDPAKDGMTRVQYTYYWYVQNTLVLTGEEYAKKVVDLGDISPADIIGPGSGEVPNTVLVPLEQKTFGFTVKRFREAYADKNPKGMGLIAFQGSKDVPGMRLSTLDKQLLPMFRMPVDRPIHMVVCRSTTLKHVVPVVSADVKVVLPPMPAPKPFDSITNDDL